MIPSQTNPTNPVGDAKQGPANSQPNEKLQQTEAEKKLAADKAANSGNSAVKS